MFGLGVGIAQGGHRIRPVGQITADFIKDRYRGGIGPGFFDLFDFVAAGNRTYINALGHMATAGPNVPRTGHHAYQGGKWVPVGLLLEPDTIQYLHYASDIVANWSHTGAELSDVDNDFVRVTSNGGSSFPRAEILGLTAGAGDYTPQVEIRQGNTDFVILRIAGTALGGGVDTNSTYQYKFSTGEFTRRNGAVALDLPQVAEVSSGVFLFWFTQEVATMDKLSVYPSWSNNTAGKYVDFRYPQLTPGRVPNSFIPNPTGAPLARAKDSLEISALTIAKLLVKYNREENMVTVGNWDPELSWAYDDGVVTHAPTHTKNAMQTDIGVVGNEFHLIDYEIFESDQGGFVTVRLGDAGTNLAVVSPNANGFYTHLVVAKSVDDSFGLRCGASLSAKFRNVKLRKVTMPTRYVGIPAQIFTSHAQWSEVSSGVYQRVGAASWLSSNVIGTVVAGKTFRVRGRIKRLAGGAQTSKVALYSRNATDDANLPVDILLGGSVVGEYSSFDIIKTVYTAGGGQAGIWVDGSGADFEIELNSVEEVIQDLTFHMQGIATFPDEDLNPQSRFLFWDAGTTDRISHDIRTAGVRTGQLKIQQKSGSEINEIMSGNDNITPGGTAFNYAASHSNLAIGAALDGTLLTTIQIPTELTYLVGQPLKFATVGHFVLTKFGLILGASGDDLLEELVQ